MTYRNSHFVSEPIEEEHCEYKSQHEAHEVGEIWYSSAVLAQIINVNGEAQRYHEVLH